MNDKLHNKMMEMVDKAGRKGLSSNVPFKEEQFSELVKLRQLSILQSAYQPQATEVNLPILAREDFTKDLVAIAYSYAGINKHRQKKHSYEYFRDNIVLYDGNHIHFNQPAIDPENMLYAFSPERIYSQRGYKLEGMDTFAIFRDVKKKHAEQEAQAQQRELFTKDLLQLGFMGNTPELLNAQVLELLKIQNQLIQQSLEQQKLAMLRQHPELLQQVVKNNAPQIDNNVMLQITSKLNERERA